MCETDCVIWDNSTRESEDYKDALFWNLINFQIQNETPTQNVASSNVEQEIKQLISRILACSCPCYTYHHKNQALSSILRGSQINQFKACIYIILAI